VRGILYAVVDLAAFLGEAPTPSEHTARLMLVGQRHGSNAALLVERVVGLRNLDKFTPAGRTRNTPWAGAEYVDAEGQRWCELEVGALLRAPEFVQVGV
jgi:twitching motility protein PilI